MRSETPLTNTEIALGVYPPATANDVVDPSPVNCCLTAVSDAVGIDTVVDVNGDWTAVVVTGPVFVSAWLLVDESLVGVIALQVSNDVPDIAESGLVGGVKLLVYKAVPLSIRKFEI